MLVRSKSHPSDPVTELGLDPTADFGMFYLTQFQGGFAGRWCTQCLAQDLPDPLNSLEIDGTVLPSYVFIHDGPRVFRFFTRKKRSVNCYDLWILNAA